MEHLMFVAIDNVPEMANISIDDLPKWSKARRVGGYEAYRWASPVDLIASVCRHPMVRAGLIKIRAFVSGNES